MIIREWRARALPSRAADYPVHFQATVLPQLQQVSGFINVHVSQRHLGGRIEFLVLSIWQSMDAVRRYAGHDVDRAVLFPEIVAVLSEFDKSVQHYEVLDTT
jgi:heme-degrading monooxygenase HmoA